MADALGSTRVTFSKTSGGNDAIQAWIQVGKRADNLSKIWDDVGLLFERRQRALFARGGQPRWKPLSPDYIVTKRRDGFAGPLLVRTGLMRDALTSRRPVKSAPKYVVFGSQRRAPHYILHKQGTRSMPKRDPLPALRKAERVEIRDIVAEHITDGWGTR